jgi:hypothetical protein
MKTKEQILEKWDPATRTMLRVNANRRQITIIYDSGGTDNDTQSCSILDGDTLYSEGDILDGGGVDTNVCY